MAQERLRFEPSESGCDIWLRLVELVECATQAFPAELAGIPGEEDLGPPPPMAEEELEPYCWAHDPRRHVACILRAGQVSSVVRTSKCPARMVGVALPRGRAHQPRKRAQPEISFDVANQPKDAADIEVSPLICTPTINNVSVARTLVDGGAGVHLLTIQAFVKLQVPFDRLTPLTLSRESPRESNTRTGESTFP